ncbi:MAG TPA: VIT domain-containing protein [Dokdonella sp.]|uniref:VIT domain-containing protein n=1 Tax=Dokdonella sp. TaxID=2291710 RepID=UPI0025C0A609|nr:VIT domain-containing protein [Dokdonella sp.]MBX3691890.1 DUF2135 domain-containing protein [Dokdonella sp.]MCW5568312.1 DUF2135 domain-containing protein [Dokdonella sp.]HNR91257.1 VIT domain-containing protein [Dokdonella sp.]
MSLPSILSVRVRALLLTLLFVASVPLHAVSIVAPPPPRVELRDGGEPVALRDLDVRAEIVGGLARTRVEMVFVNPNARVLEGELVFPLLDGQAVDGFALDIDGVLRDAVPVEKARGKQVFEDTIRRRVDPALLETAGGNVFRLRVYPLPAKGTRRVVVWISEALEGRDGQWSYRYPLAQANKLASFALEIDVANAAQKPVLTRADGLDGALKLAAVGTRYRATVRRNDFVARGWVELAVPDGGADTPAPALVERWNGARYLYADLPLALPRLARRPASRVGLVWDSSASARQRDHAAEFSLLDAYFREMRNGEVALVRVRDVVEDGGRYTIRDGDWQALKRALQETVYDGATNLAAWKIDATLDEILVFTDGHANYGTGVLPAGLDQAKARIIPVNASASSDRAVLRRLARDGVVVDLTRGLEAASGALLTTTATILAIEAAGDADIVADAEAWSRGRLRLHGRITGEPPRELRVRVREAIRGERVVNIPLAAAVEAEPGSVPFAARLWARQRIERLEGERGLHRATIRRLGLEFGLVTRETSLIVLDTVADYARHGIEPPAPLRGEYLALREREQVRERKDRDAHLDTIAAQYADKLAWWNRDFQKTKPPLQKVAGEAYRQSHAVLAEAAPMAAGAPPPPPSPPPSAAPARDEQRLESVQVTGSRMRRADVAAAAPGQPAPVEATIALKKWTPDAPYIARLREADAKALYATYLDERVDWQDSSAFYLDVADLLFERKLDALALRVLSNLAELELENRQVLRILGYRLLQADQAALAVPLFEEVRELAPFEPQSFRDLGLAYAAAGTTQKAADALYEVAARPWDPRFAEVGLIALTELNALIATKAGIDTARYDARLLRNLPVDLRVVLSWDADNSDMDLWVTDPHGERAFYGHRLTHQGGRMSADLTAGYGPEEFMLKRAIPGTYRVEVNYYGNRQQVVSGTVSLRLAFFTGFGRPGQQEQSVILRLRDQRETVLVGEFEVK